MMEKSSIENDQKMKQPQASPRSEMQQPHIQQHSIQQYHIHQGMAGFGINNTWDCAPAHLYHFQNGNGEDSQMRSNLEYKPANNAIPPIAPSPSTAVSSRARIPSISSCGDDVISSNGTYSLFSSSPPSPPLPPTNSTKSFHGNMPGGDISAEDMPEESVSGIYLPRGDMTGGCIPGGGIPGGGIPPGGGMPGGGMPGVIMDGGVIPTGGFGSGELEGTMLHTGGFRSSRFHVANNDPLEAVLGLFPCARLRGLPVDASLEDVLVFFQGLVVLDVVVVGDSYGQGYGEAFVVFANPMDFQMALQRDRQSLGRLNIEVFQGKRADYYAAIAMQFRPCIQGKEYVEGESSSPQEPSVQGNAWTAGASPAPTQVLRSSSASQKVVLDNNASATGPHSVGKGSGGFIGSRPGRGVVGGEGIRPKGSNTGRGVGRGGGIQVGEHTGYLRMRGLPFISTKKEIFDFFKCYEPVEDSITLTYRSDGRATGEGYIAFKGPDNAKDAMMLHRNTLGSRYIEIFISNKEEHARSLARENNAR